MKPLSQWAMKRNAKTVLDTFHSVELEQLNQLMCSGFRSFQTGQMCKNNATQKDAAFKGDVQIKNGF